MDSENKCPLCESTSIKWLERHGHCLHCLGHFLKSEFLPHPEEERRQYCLHENSVDDPRYLKHLKKLADPARNFIKPGDRLLDFGCGPVKAMAHLLQDLPVQVDSYDPLFFPDFELQKNSYDMILAAEVVEHFHSPKESFELLFNLLKPGGVLAIMTQFWNESIDINTWWYARDPTHVFFYHQDSFVKAFKHRKILQQSNSLIFFQV